MNSQFEIFMDKINEYSSKYGFALATEKVTQYIDVLSKDDLICLVREIGTIPEQIEASSTKEKLFSKASDTILAKCFRELGMSSVAVRERANSADIQAESIHGYTLVADAKTFRLSRTAKNQKDFKISTLSNWRGSEHDYAVLVAPYFQYPNTVSQIYSSALEHKVCLLSWEHILFLINNDVKETDAFSLENIWNAPVRLERDTRIAYADRMHYHIPNIDKMVCDRISKPISDFIGTLDSCKEYIRQRGRREIVFLNAEKMYIENLSKEDAIQELLKSKKVLEKIETIERLINSL